MCLQVGRLEGLESEVDQLQHVLQSVAAELESGHQTAQVSLSSCILVCFHRYLTKQASYQAREENPC